jgi:hypothetical protein
LLYSVLPSFTPPLTLTSTCPFNVRGMGEFKHIIWVTVKVYIYQELAPDPITYKRVIDTALLIKYGNRSIIPPSTVSIGLDGPDLPAL